MKSHFCSGSSAEYIEMSFNQLLGLMEMTMKVTETDGFPEDRIDLIRVRIHAPGADGLVSVDYGIPASGSGHVN